MRFVNKGSAQPVTTQSKVYYYYTDHLNTPQLLTDENQNIVWQASMQPFGQVDIQTEKVTNNLRFPGQYYDAETGKHYNYYRDYNPGTGRYLQSDPIGLQGGLNTYGYVYQSPLHYTNVFGLKALYCKRPLGDYSGENGGGPPIFNHQFVCVTLADGTVRCDSNNNPDDDKNPLTPAPGEPSRPERDNESIAQCINIDDDEDRCFENCVLTQWSKSRPDYAIGPLGTDCQEYSSNIVRVCKTQCP